MIGPLSFHTTVVGGTEVIDYAVAGAIVLGAFLLGYATKNLLRQIAKSTGVDDFAEGTTFERIAESFGTSTVGIVARTVAWLVYLSGFLVALQYLSIGVLEQNILTRITSYAPNVVAAVFILIFGAVLSDKAGILVSEKLEGIKVTDVSIFPTLVKYSILFVAVLMALNQLGISTTALNILLISYLVGIIVFTVVGLRRMLSSAVSGLYILVTQPYGIGDRVRIGEIEGVVQEVDVFTTRLEDGEREYMVPNYEVFEKGVSREIQ